MKLLGILAILTGGCLGAGYSLRMRRERIRLLRDLGASLRLMASELSFRAVPMAELTEILAKKSQGGCAVFYHALESGMEQIGELRFAQLWERTAVRTLPLLPEGELTELCRLGASLGRFDAEKQSADAEYCASRLLQAAEREEKDLERSGRLIVGLWLSGAAMVILLLV